MNGTELFRPSMLLQPKREGHVEQESRGPASLLNVVALKGNGHLAFESPVERLIGAYPSVGYICHYALHFLVYPKLSQHLDLPLLIALQRLQLGGSDGFGSDLEGSEASEEDVERKTERTADRSARLPGHLSTSM